MLRAKRRDRREHLSGRKIMSGTRCANPKYSVLILGPNGSGKTSLIRRMKHHSHVNFYDTAGAEELTDKWSLHFGKVQGYIFVIDSTDRRKCGNTSHELAKFLLHPDVESKPVLLVAAKMDTDGALDEDVIFNVYDLVTLLHEHRNVRFSCSDLPHNALGYVNTATKLNECKNAEGSTSSKRQGATLQQKNSHYDTWPFSVEVDADESQEPAEVEVVKTMTFKRGTIWLMEEIERNKKEIDRRISLYMNANGIEVRKSLKSLTKLQKKWEKQKRRDARSRDERDVEEEDAEGPNLDEARKSVRASDSAEKLRRRGVEEKLRSSSKGNGNQQQFPHPRSTVSLFSGRLAHGEVVKSKRGVSFQEGAGETQGGEGEAGWVDSKR